MSDVLDAQVVVVSVASQRVIDGVEAVQGALKLEENPTKADYYRAATAARIKLAGALFDAVQAAAQIGKLELLAEGIPQA